MSKPKLDSKLKKIIAKYANSMRATERLIALHMGHTKGKIPTEDLRDLCRVAGLFEYDNFSANFTLNMSKDCALFEGHCTTGWKLTKRGKDEAKRVFDADEEPARRQPRTDAKPKPKKKAKAKPKKAAPKKAKPKKKTATKKAAQKKATKPKAKPAPKKKATKKANSKKAAPKKQPSKAARKAALRKKKAEAKAAPAPAPEPAPTPTPTPAPATAAAE